MGDYLNGSAAHPLKAEGKAYDLVNHFDAVVIEPLKDYKDIPEGYALVCVVSNPYFEAAALCRSNWDLAAFLSPIDTRPRIWLLMTAEKAAEASGVAFP